MSSRSTHVVTNDRMSFSWVNNIPLCIYPVFIHSSADGHLGCFYILTIINIAATNMEIYMSVPIYHILLSFPLQMYPEVELLDYMVVLFLIF